jgi:hypothetical protein
VREEPPGFECARRRARVAADDMCGQHSTYEHIRQAPLAKEILLALLANPYNKLDLDGADEERTELMALAFLLAAEFTRFRDGDNS